MGGRKKKRSPSAKKKGGRARYDPHVNLDALEAKDECSRVDRKTLKNFLCFREGCGQSGRIDRWCGDTCWGCVYCSERCFHEDLDEGKHRLLCRYTEGQDNFELLPVPDDRYNRPRHDGEDPGYQHKGLYAKRDIARDSIAVKQAPLVFKIRRPSTRSTELFLKKCFHHADYMDRSDDNPLKYATLNHLLDEDGDFPKDTIIYSSSQTKYIIETLLTGNLSRTIKWILPKVRCKAWYVDSDVEDDSFTFDGAEIRTGVMRMLQKVISECTIKGTETLSDEFNGVYTFDLLSYFNHSCVPNVKCVILGDVMNFVALRNIRKGEELTIAYTHVETRIDREARKAHLKDTMNFDCACEACLSFSDTLPTGFVGGVVSAVCDGFIPFRNQYSDEWYSLYERYALSNVLKSEMVNFLKRKVTSDMDAARLKMTETNLDFAIKHAIASVGIEELDEKNYPKHMRRLLPVSASGSFQVVNGASRAMVKAAEDVYMHKAAVRISTNLAILTTTLFSMNRRDMHLLGSVERVHEILNDFRIVYYLELAKDSGAKANLLTSFRSKEGQTLLCGPSFRFVDPLLRIYARFVQSPELMYDVTACSKDREIRAQIERVDILAKKHSHPGFDAAMMFGRYYGSDTMMFLYFVAEEVLAKKREANQ